MDVTDGLIVREMRSDDLDQVLELERATFAQPWSRKMFLDEMAAERRCYLVAEDAGGVVGYGGFTILGEDLHINTLLAARPARVPAIGTRLMRSLIDRGLEGGARRLYLEVRASNRRAQDFYRKFGLAPVGVRKHYYHDDDALIMWAHDIGGDDYRDRLDRIEAALP